MTSRSMLDRPAVRSSTAASRAPARPARASAIPASIRPSGGVRRARREVSPSICSANVTAGQYLAFGLPALIAGIATSHFGLHDTALVYSVVIALLAVAAAAGFLFEGNARTRAPRAVAPPPELPPGPCTVPPR